MKMRWFDRALQLVSGLVLLALGMLLLLFSAGAFRLDAFSMDALFAEPWQWTPVFMAASVLLIALGLRLVIMSFSAKKGKYYAVRSSNSDHVQISIQAIDHLTRKCLKRYTEIFLSHVSIKGQQDAIVIHLRMAVRSDVRIPELVAQIRSDVKAYIEECSGVKVEHVEVMVEATKDVDLQDELMPAPKPTPLLPPVAEPSDIPPEDMALPGGQVSMEMKAPAADWYPQEDDIPETFKAPDIIVRDDSAPGDEVQEVTLGDGRDPLFFSSVETEPPFAKEAEPSVESDETIGTPGADAPVFVREDELVSLDALEAEMEEQDAENESDDEQSGDQAWEGT